MGLFGKLKENFKHGGVSLTLQAPTSVSLQDASLPVSVTITASDEAQTIKRVSAEIIATSQTQAFSTSGIQNNANQNNVQQHTVARIDNNESFSLAPGESRTVQLTLTMSGAAQAMSGMAGMDPNSTGAHILNTVVAGLKSADASQYSYDLKASADVDGITLDPAKSQPLQINAPGQIGGSFRINV
jgi:hypothetical protein